MIKKEAIGALAAAFLAASSKVEDRKSRPYEYNKSQVGYRKKREQGLGEFDDIVDNVNWGESALKTLYAFGSPQIVPTENVTTYNKENGFYHYGNPKLGENPNDIYVIDIPSQKRYLYAKNPTQEFQSILKDSFSKKYQPEEFNSFLKWYDAQPFSKKRDMVDDIVDPEISTDSWLKRGIKLSSDIPLYMMDAANYFPDKIFGVDHQKDFDERGNYKWYYHPIRAWWKNAWGDYRNDPGVEERTNRYNKIFQEYETWKNSPNKDETLWYQRRGATDKENRWLQRYFQENNITDPQLQQKFYQQYTKTRRAGEVEVSQYEPEKSIFDLNGNQYITTYGEDGTRQIQYLGKTPEKTLSQKVWDDTGLRTISGAGVGGLLGAGVGSLGGNSLLGSVVGMGAGGLAGYFAKDIQRKLQQ